MQNAIKYIQSQLHGLYPETEIKSFCNIIIEKLTGFSRIEILVNKNTKFSVEQQHEIENIIGKLKMSVPIQYVFAETEFYGLSFNLNESVLIPRPETEELVNWIETENDTSANISMLDIGTGSGCIAITLKHLFPTATVDAFDISELALATAQSNAKSHKLEVNFRLVDILNVPNLDKKWDIIVSNPPYVVDSEKANMLPNVLDYEPHLALFVPDNDPLLFYRHIAQFAKNHLSPKGKIYLEINRAFGDQCIALLVGMGFCDIQLRKDISGNDRMIQAILAPNHTTLNAAL